MRKAAWAFLISFAFAIPWEYSLDLGAPFGNIARVLGLGLLLIAIPTVLLTGRLHRPGKLEWMTAALYLWFCCTFFWTVTPQSTLVKLRGYPQEMMLIWLVPEFVERPDDVRKLLRAWLAGSWVLALLTVGSFVWADMATADQVRFVAAGQDPNDTARFLNFGFPIAALLLERRENWLGRLLAVGYLPLGLAAVLLTASRSGFLVAIMALGGGAVLVAKRDPQKALVGVFAISALFAIVWTVAPPGTLERLGTISEQLQSGDLNQRADIWRAGWQAFLGAPIIGHGAGSFVSAAGLAPIDTAHNTMLAVVVEGGLCALVPALAILIISIVWISGLPGAIRIGLGILMAVWLVSSLVGTVGENRTTWLLLGLVAACQRLTGISSEAIRAAFQLDRRRQHIQRGSIEGLVPVQNATEIEG